MPVLGSRATAFYKQELESLHAPGILSLHLVVTDFEQINANLPENYPALFPLLETLMVQLEATPATMYLVPNITLHTAFATMNLEKNLLNRLINPIDCCISFLKDKCISRITLVGTRHTMQSKQLAGFFEHGGIAVDFPAMNDIETLDSIRLQVFYEGYSPAANHAMTECLAGYDNVVLACTELSLLNRTGSASGSRVIDMARLQLSATIPQP